MSSDGASADVASPPLNSHDASGDSKTEARQQASDVIDFLIVAGRLKRTQRQGWVYQGLQHVESVADHSHRMALMALLAANAPGIDRDRCVKIAVVHDLAEAIVGDITPADGVPKEEKRRRESAAMDSMCKPLGSLGVEIMELWQEYEDAQTEEAKLVKDYDKIEMILQAWEYEQEQGQNLEEFFESTKGKFQTKLGQAYAREVVERRSKSQTQNN